MLGAINPYGERIHRFRSLSEAFYLGRARTAVVDETRGEDCKPWRPFAEALIWMALELRWTKIGASYFKDNYSSRSIRKIIA